MKRTCSQLLLFVAGFGTLAAMQCRMVAAQTALPIPAHPSRGLPLPGEPSTTDWTRHYSCDLVEQGEGEPVPTLIPERLHHIGPIVGEYIYTGEVFNNARGGLNTNDATLYRGNLDLVFTLDTEAAGLWSGGRLLVYANQFHGRTLSLEDVGDVQFYSNIEGDPRPADTFQLNEYWYEQVSADGRILTKVGKQDANADFAYVDLGGDFVHSSFGQIPTVPLPTWPNPGLGIAVIADVSDVLHLKGGIYDGTATTGPSTGGRSGFESLGDYGMMLLSEVLITSSLAEDEALTGAYRVGAWYHSDNFDDLRPGATDPFRENYGMYLGIDQLLWLERCSDDSAQGLGVFFQFGWAPSDRNEIDLYLGGGLTYQGLAPGRPDDLFGVGIANAGFRDQTLDPERAVELFYKFQLTPCSSLQPDLQYISNPAGSIDDALVIGLRTEVVL
ncbi:carbohydrate porin [Rhodopirellula sp. MGV]|uniref:carbohydrate porin n=1 Tax=Rhodopirellula sp. MGV TaxID=2023130 RepID=UPI000B96BC9E|nr:carbohydrate porin [Rhodopirellula sp. MGV]OYP28417.1 hypothetical protein CGZ80_26800 [Rhodopirellula sp. MGV]PNY38707.1 carbohydrate porin [Rhodopirellula baltica]